MHIVCMWNLDIDKLLYYEIFCQFFFFERLDGKIVSKEDKFNHKSVSSQVYTFQFLFLGSLDTIAKSNKLNNCKT